MKSPLLLNLEAKISAATDAISEACWRTERATYLARKGDENEAKAEIAIAREINLQFGDARLSCWIHLAEGVLALTAGDERLALDRFERARAVAGAVFLQREASIITAWLAYVDYTHGAIGSMVSRINGVLRADAASDDSAVARSKMLIAQSFHFAGDFESAREWYKAANILITTIGDRVLLSSLLFNIASHHICNYRQHIFRGGVSSASQKLLELTTDSVANYDRVVGITSLKAFETTLIASTHLFNERFADASSLLEAFLQAQGDHGLFKMKALYVADLAYCMIKMGFNEKALCLAEDANTTVLEQPHSEIYAATRSRLAQIYALSGLDKRAEEHRCVANAAWEEHEASQQEILDLMRISLDPLALEIQGNSTSKSN